MESIAVYNGIGVIGNVFGYKCHITQLFTTFYPCTWGFSAPSFSCPIKHDDAHYDEEKRAKAKAKAYNGSSSSNNNDNLILFPSQPNLTSEQIADQD